MTIKDFKVGEKAFIIIKNEVKAVDIIKVGKKYVYIKGCNPFYLRNEKDNHLVENKDWGACQSLYLKRQDAIDIIDRRVIINELIKVTGVGNRELPIDKLRKIYEIIKEET